MRAGRTLLILLSLQLIASSSFAASELTNFVNCLIDYQAKVETERTAKARSNEESAGVKRLPSVSTSLTQSSDLMNRTQSSIDPQWTVSMSQSIYSYSESREIEANSQILKSEIESTRVDILNGLQEQMDLLLGLISAKGRVQVLKAQIESQKKTLHILEVMVQARIIDGSQMLMAESDLMQTTVSLKDAEMTAETNEKNLKILPFFKPSQFQDEKLIEKFFADSEIEPIRPEQRPEIKAYEALLKANQNLYQKESKEWIPRLDASIQYVNYLENKSQQPYPSELTGNLTLTIPFSEFFQRDARSTFYSSEINRITILSERKKNNLKVNSESEKRNLQAAKDQIVSLRESLTSLSKAKEILQRKLQLNRATYIEFAGLEDRINQTENMILEKKISIWKILARWEAEKKSATGNLWAAGKKSCQSVE